MRGLLLLLFPIWLVLGVDGGLKLFLLGVRLWRRTTKADGEDSPLPPANYLSFAVVIPAHNEEEVIGETVQRLRRLNYPPDHYTIVVLADGCTDKTVQYAQEQGARCVMWEGQTGRGKGRALSWLLTVEQEYLKAWDILLVCDADTRLHQDALLRFNRKFLQGMQVGQGRVASDLPASSQVGALLTLSEALSQEVDDQARRILRWPVPLRGTGMAFRREILQHYASHLHTRAEDMELSLLLALGRVPVVFVPEAIIYDPKPAGMAAATRQRARWFQGQREVVRRYWRELLTVLVRGNLGERALLCSLLLRPRTLVVCAKATSLVGCLWLGPVLPWWIRWLLVAGASFAVMADLLYYAIGPSLLPDVARRRVLLRFPLYGLLWLRAVILSVVSATDWLSVRKRDVKR